MTKTSVIFPYSGYTKNSQREHIFWKTIKLCREVDDHPIIILNRDTEIEGSADTFLQSSSVNELIIERVWSVDICQMWLHGWGYILDKFEN